MKILLVQAYIEKSESPVFPIGLSYLSAAIKEYNFKIFDPNVSAEPYADFSDLLVRFRPDLIGISV